MRLGKFLFPGFSGRGRFLPPISSGGIPDSGSPVVLSAFGDSIYNGYGVGANPIGDAVSQLSAATGRTVTLGANVSQNGYFSSYWLDPTASYKLSDARAAVSAANSTHVLINMGVNDERVNIPVSEFKASMTTIINAFKSDGVIPIICYPNYVYYSQAGADLQEQYLEVLYNFVDGSTVLLGDTTSYVYFRTNPSAYQGDNVHPNSGGYSVLSDGIVAGVVNALHNFSGLPTAINGDGSLNVSGWRSYFDDMSPKATSARLGPKSSIPDSSLTAIYTPPNNYSNGIYDRQGFGLGPYWDTGSIHAPDPNSDVHPMYSAFQVMPYQYGPPKPTFTAENGNFNLGIPYHDPAYFRIILNNSPVGGEQWYADYAGCLLRLDDNYWGNSNAGDYWSDFATVIAVSRDPKNYGGVENHQTNAHYNDCFSDNVKRNDGGVRGSLWADPSGQIAGLNGSPPSNPMCIARAPFENCGECLIINREGVMTSINGPTTRPSYLPTPTYKFPSNERPYLIGISSMAEFAGVVVQDLTTNKSKVVMFALQGYAIPGHSPAYVGVANEGGFTKIVRIGEFDLGVKLATAITLGCDSQLPEAPEKTGYWLSSQGTRDAVRTQAGERSEFVAIARKGFISVCSKLEDKVENWNFSNYVEFVFQSYTVSNQTTYDATVASMEAGAFPVPFSGSGARTDLAPTLISSVTVARPTCLLASGGIVNNPTGDSYKDHDKLLVGSESGLVTVFNTSPIMDRLPLRQYSTFSFDVYGTFQVGSVGSNITSMCWSKIGQDSNASRVASTGVMATPTDQPFEWLNLVHVCCRADRAIYSVCTRFDITASPPAERGVVYRTIQDPRIKDPVDVSMASRSFNMLICDHDGMMVHNVVIGGHYRGEIRDASNGNYLISAARYNPANPSGEFAYVNAAHVAGHPIMANQNNIN